MPSQPTRPNPGQVQWGGNSLKPTAPASAPPQAPGVATPATGPRVRRWAFVAAIVVAFLAGGLSPVRADTNDRALQLLERISDSLRELAHREVRVVCECKS